MDTFILWRNVGGGVALLYASKVLEKLKGNNFDQKIGIQVIQNALKVLWFIVITFLLVIAMGI